MEKNIWLLNNNKNELIDSQNKINADGSMRTICFLKYESVEAAVKRQDYDESRRPSLIILDYDTEVDEDFKTMTYLQNLSAYAGIPLIFMVNSKSSDIDEICYEKGATIVLLKPFTRSAVLRIERTAWQYEKTRNYENLLHKQTNELVIAKKIKRLNEQLESRNELLHKIFDKYFSDEVVEVILNNPQGSAIGGEKREITVLMADIRGFTSISEDLPADSVTDIINNFLKTMTDIIFSYHGSVIEFIGDAILAVFGAPFNIEAPEENAIAAAISMQNAMVDVNKYNISRYYPQIEMGIGISSGEVFVGNIGSDRMMRYNVIGRAVNLCSRIESFSIGGQILVSDYTISRVGCKINYTDTFSIFAKGINSNIVIYAVNGINGKYECNLMVKNPSDIVKLKNPVRVKIYVLQNKKVEDIAYDGYLEYLSTDRGYFRINDNKYMDIFTNIMINCNDESKFKNLYGKIIEKKDNLLTIKFAYISKDFEIFQKNELE